MRAPGASAKCRLEPYPTRRGDSLLCAVGLTALPSPWTDIIIHPRSTVFYDPQALRSVIRRPTRLRRFPPVITMLESEVARSGFLRLWDRPQDRGVILTTACVMMSCTQETAPVPHRVVREGIDSLMRNTIVERETTLTRTRGHRGRPRYRSPLACAVTAPRAPRRSRHRPCPIPPAASTQA